MLWPYDDNDPLNPPDSAHILPKYPTVEGYQETPMVNEVRNSPDIGVDKVRVRFTDVPVKVSERYILKRSQVNALRSFYKSISNGADRFIKPDPMTNLNKEYRFVSPYTTTPLGGELYEVLIELERMPL